MAEWSPEHVVDARLARILVEGQFPELTGLPLRLLGEGWDSTVWAVGERWAFRFPRRDVVVPSLARQAAVLPRLAPLLPLAVPVPVFCGEPAEGYPWPFRGAELLPGGDVSETPVSDAEREAAAPVLGAFLRVLHGPDALALPGVAELPVDLVRRADMTLRVPMTSERLAEAEALGLWRPPGWVASYLDAARTLAPPRRLVLAHGDLHLRHLLFHRGAASAVIDWVDVCRADAAIDLMLVWALLPPAARGAFAAAYGPIEPDQLVRSRVLSLFLSATLAVYARHEALPALEREALRALDLTVAGGRESHVGLL